VRGAERKDNKFLPGDQEVLSFDLDAITIDEGGKVQYSTSVEVLDGLISVAFSLASIALGTLVGASLYKWLTERLNWWQLQIGRVGSYFRRERM
jgi:hypothetical protein